MTNPFVISENENTMTFINTTVYVGDPCYVFNNNNPEHNDYWDKFCTAMFPKDHPSIVIDSGTVDFLDHRFLFTSTAHGDGEYGVRTRSIGGPIGVDAGLISVIPMSLVLKLNKGDEKFIEWIKTAGLIVENFTGTVAVEDHGFVGDVICVTTFDEEDEDEDDEYDEEYDMDYEYDDEDY